MLRREGMLPTSELRMATGRVLLRNRLLGEKEKGKKRKRGKEEEREGKNLTSSDGTQHAVILNRR